MYREKNILDVYKIAPADFRKLNRNRTVVVVPFAPIEYHGDHLPLGTDYILAGQLLRDVAKDFISSYPEWIFLFHPVIPLGTDTIPHGGSLWVSPKIIRDVAHSISEQYIKYGFRYVALLSGHGGFRQSIALEEVSQKMCQRYKHKKVKVFAPLNYFLQRVATKEFIKHLNSHLSQPLEDEDIRQMPYEGHGGRFETSYILSAAPEFMTDLYKTAESNEPLPNPIIKVFLEGLSNILRGKHGQEMHSGIMALAISLDWFYKGAKKGYMGFPSRASVEFGNALRKVITKELVDYLEQILLKGKIPGMGKEMAMVLRLLVR